MGWKKEKKKKKKKKNEAENEDWLPREVFFSLTSRLFLTVACARKIHFLGEGGISIRRRQGRKAHHAV